MIKRILLGLGGTPYTTVAIQRAVQLARRYDAEITGVVVVNPERLKKSGAGDREGMLSASHRIIMTRELIEQAVNTFQSSCAAEGIRYRIEQSDRETAVDQIISLARYHDLMIFGLRGIFEYDISFEEPQETLARLISAGVRPIIAESDKFRPIHKVLIAYSGSMESAKIMKRFVQLRLWPESTVRIGTFHRSEEKARELLNDASEYCRAHGFQVEQEWNPGPPKEFLLPMASLRQSDMIVLGNSAQRLLTKRALGETVLHIIRYADRPLFVSQ
ncbi:MAG TPA: universal stress protein [Syntrophorhabdaceae bacterium]